MRLTRARIGAQNEGALRYVFTGVRFPLIPRELKLELFNVWKHKNSTHAAFDLSASTCIFEQRERDAINLFKTLI